MTVALTGRDGSIGGRNGFTQPFVGRSTEFRFVGPFFDVRPINVVMTDEGMLLPIDVTMRPLTKLQLMRLTA